MATHKASSVTPPSLQPTLFTNPTPTVNWSRGSSLVNMVGDASFRVMASRSVQSAAVAAQKAANGGDFTVNINSSGTSSSSTSGSSSSSGGGNSSSGGSTSGGDDSGDGGLA